MDGAGKYEVVIGVQRIDADKRQTFVVRFVTVATFETREEAEALLKRIVEMGKAEEN